jgi:hypothetical protein
MLQSIKKSLPMLKSSQLLKMLLLKLRFRLSQLIMLPLLQPGFKLSQFPKTLLLMLRLSQFIMHLLRLRFRPNLLKIQLLNNKLWLPPSPQRPRLQMLLPPLL